MGNQQVTGTVSGPGGALPSSRRSGGALFADGVGGAQGAAAAATDDASSSSVQQQHPHHPQYQQHHYHHHKPPPGGSAPMGYMQSHAAQYPGMAQPPPGGGGGGMMRDHSMTDIMMSSCPDRTTTTVGNNNNNMSSSSSMIAPPTTSLDIAALSAAEEDSVPTVFRWEHGGRNVYITGTFNGWSRQIPMHRSGNDFTYIHNLKRGKHAFKFIVDDEWRFAPDQPTVADIEGRINNFIDVTDFKPYTGDTQFETEGHYADHCSRAAAVEALKKKKNKKNDNNHKTGNYHHDARDTEAVNSNGDGGGSGAENDESSSKASHQRGGGGNTDPDGEIYGHSMPDLDEYTKEPPPLPPHLRHIILNKPPQLTDTAALPVPQHVALNHLYCTAIKDNMMVLGITQRYKMKSCTTVYYSPC